MIDPEGVDYIQPLRTNQCVFGEKEVESFPF